MMILMIPALAWAIGVFFVSVVLGVLSHIIFRQYETRKDLNKEIMLTEAKLKLAREENKKLLLNMAESWSELAAASRNRFSEEARQHAIEAIY